MRAYLADPPAASKTRAAIEFGIDLTLTARNVFTLTPEERLHSLERAVASLKSARRTVLHS